MIPDEDCGDCDGTGEIECYACLGEGADAADMGCLECDATGKLGCPECNWTDDDAEDW